VDLLAERRLGDVEPLGGLAEVEFLGHGDNVAEVSKLHVSLDARPVAAMRRWSIRCWRW
jgi:hypothetical protein